MRRIALTSLLVLASLITPAFAQGRGGFIGAGSTPQGDYLRGIGIEAWGEGLYNFNTARAYSIAVDANIKLDTYLSAVFRAERDNYQKLNRQEMEKINTARANYKARLRENPNTDDIFSGNAINMAFEELNNPLIQESSRRLTQVPIPVDTIRRIPFKLDQRGQVFSIQRLTAHGVSKWPVAFQDDKFKTTREAYERAIDKAMDQMIDKKMPEQTIKEYTGAVWDLRNQFDREFGEKNGTDAKEARVRLHEMEAATELLKIAKIQSVMAEIDRYSGKTVDDLREFMLAHNLRFAAVNNFSEEERRMYVQLYESFDQMRKALVGTPGGRDR